MKVSTYTPLFFFLFCAYFSVYSTNWITGSVLDESSEPVAFANVVLLSPTDSTSVYRGAVADESGSFTFENIVSNQYILSVSFIGYEDLQRKIAINKDSTIEQVVLVEEESGLDEITIQARKPKITRSVDRIVFDVENSILSSGSSWDILRKTPGVVVAGGQLMVRNGVVAIYINDRKVQLTAEELRELLESYSAANIKSVEV